MQEAMKKAKKNGNGGGHGGNHNQNSGGEFGKPSAEENNRRIIDGSAMFYHKKIDSWINYHFPLGAKVTQ
jgi:hypothetical protein